MKKIIIKNYQKFFRTEIDETKNIWILIKTFVFNRWNTVYEKEFYEIFSEILILPKNIFFQSILSNIKKSLIVHNNEKIFDSEQILTLIKSYQNKYEKKYDECLGEINIFLKFFNRLLL